jgi:Salmonella virulence plasmid 65kDa B protein/FG-GAP-like repeat
VTTSEQNKSRFESLKRRLPRCARIALAALASVSVGAFAQGVTVSESGQAIYSLPIAVPPGVGGMEPKLSLVYNNGGINGPVGVGWAVQGISQITRCGQISRGADNKPTVKSVKLDANDSLCLDGQRLIKVTSSAGAWEGTAASDQSNAAQSGVSTEFRTETDTFSRIRASGAVGDLSFGPATFVAESKAGLISEYGRSGGSDDGIVRAAGGSKSGVASAWLLRRVSDTVGNTMNFHYEQATPTWGTGADGVASPGREWNLVGVSYGCNANVACSSVHMVKLSYGDRADKAESYHMGSKVVSTKLLNRIEVRVGATPAGVALPIGGALVRAYKLTHESSARSSRSMLAAIAECSNEASAADNCLPPHTFRYSGAFSSYGSASFNLGSTPLSSWNGRHGVITGDFNGDGKTDLLRWDNRSGSPLTLQDQPNYPGITRYTNVLWLADAKVAGKFNQAPLFNQALSTTAAQPDATNSASVVRLGGGAEDGSNLKDGYVETYAVDINGDGRADLISVCKYAAYCGDKPLRMWLSFSGTELTAADYGVFREIDIPVTGPREFDAAGVDLLRSTSGPLYPSSFSSRVRCREIDDGQYSYGTHAMVKDAIWQDFDGDGRVDLVNMEYTTSFLSATTCYDAPPSTTGARRTLRYYSGRGDGTFVLKQAAPMSSAHRAVADRAKSGLSYMEVMDIDADGRPDILFRNSRWLQNAAGTFDFVAANVDPAPQHADYRMLVIDANGDGKSDVITVDPDARIPHPNGSGLQVSANPYAARLFINRGDGGFFRDDRPITRINSLGDYSESMTQALGWMYYGSGLHGSTPLDYNGDGQTDFLVWVTKLDNGGPVVDSLRLYVAKGGTDSGKPNGTVPGVSSIAATHGLPQDLAIRGNSFSGGDFLGVGSAGFIKMGNNGGNSLHARFGAPPDLLEQVITPTRLTTTVTYSSTGVATLGASTSGVPITPAVYQNVRPPLAVPPGSAALLPADFVNLGTYPIYYAHPVQWVVSRTIQSGAASNVTTAFLYRGMAVDLSGGGSLGFEAVSKYFPYANGGMLVTTSEYLQDPDQRQYQGMPRCTYTMFNPTWKPNEVREPVDEELDRDRRRGLPARKSTRDTAMSSKPLVPSSASVCADSDTGPTAGAARAIAMTTYVYGDVRAQTESPTLLLPTEVASLVKRPYQKLSTERKWDLNNPSQLVSKVVTTNTEMTVFGDVKRSTVDTTQYDGRLGTQTWTKQTANDYDLAAISDTKWHLGRLSRSAVSSTTPTTALPTPNSTALTAQQRATQDPALTATPPRPLTPEQLSAILQLLLLDD